MYKVKNKDMALEILRIISAFFVIFNHTDGYKFFETTDNDTIKFWIYLFVSVFCKFAVPLFFMISGALLLGKEEPLSVVLKKRVLRIFIVLFVVSVIYYIRNVCFNMSPLSVYVFFGKLFESSIAGQLWFLYGYLAFLLLLPFLRLVIKKMTNELFIYGFILSGIFMCVVPLLQYFVFNEEYVIHNSFDIFSINIIINPIVGYFIYNKIDFVKIKLKHIITLWSLNLAFLCFTCFITYLIILKAETQDVFTEKFFHTFSALNAAALFITFKKYIGIIKCGKIKNIICLASESTFGIYLLHILMFDLGPLYIPSNLVSRLGLPMISNLVLCAVTFIFCMVVVLLLKKIPVIKNYI